MQTVLIVEDDKSLSNGIYIALKDDSKYHFIQSYCLEEARKIINGQSLDLIIMDINLPDGSGLDLLREVRMKSEVPIIILTANDMETDVVMGLELGANDYITKPFSLMILRARVSVQLRKEKQGQQDHLVQDCFIQDDFRFEFDKMLFTKKQQVIELSKTEQKLLRLLVENKGRTLAREVLIDRIWTDGTAYVDENALSVTIKRLRDKLEEHSATPRYIKTVYGIGYRWENE